jgi:hypothetical protein
VNSSVNILSGVGVDLSDPFAVDFAGIGLQTPFQGDYWNLYGQASDFSKIFGRTTPVPYFPGSAAPAACTAAAAAEPTNSNVPGSSGLASLASFGCYMAGKSVIVPPAFGTIGNMYRNEITGAPFREWDFSVAKQWRFWERVTAQFRAEFFNLTNSRNYGAASGDPVFSSSFGVSTAPVTAGNAVNGTGDSRRVQMGLKFMF